MALTEKDLLSAIAKLKERNALEAQPTERISVADWKAQHAPSMDATRLVEESKKVQEKVAESVSKTDGDGLNANAKKTYDQMKKTTEGITQLVKQSKEQSDAIASLAENTEVTRGPIEKLVTFMSNMKEKLSPKNIKETILNKASKTFGNIPLVGSMIKKSAEKESWIKIQQKLDPTATRKDLAEDYKSYREAHKETRAASAEYEKTRKMFGMSDSQFAKTAEGKRLAGNQVDATTKLAKYDRRANLIANENSEGGPRETADREPRTKDEERLVEKLKPETGQEGKTGRMAERGIVKELNRLAGVDPAVNATRKDAGTSDALQKMKDAEEYSDEQLEILKKIEENTRPSQVAGGAKARALPPKGKEVTFSGQKYRFQGQQWVEINEKTGKQGRIAERGIVGELNKRAGVPKPNIIPEKAAPKMGFGDRMKSIGGGIKNISGGMIDAAKGIVAIGASLVVLSFGLKQFKGIDFESLAKVALAVGGLVVTSKLLGDNMGSMMKGALGIAALGGALWLASKGFEAFGALDWEALAKAGVALGGLALAAAGIGAFVAPILLGAAAIAGIGASVWVLAKGIDALASAMDRVRSPKAANKPAGGEAPAEQLTTAAAEQPAGAPAEGNSRPISGNIQAKQTGPGQYEAVSSGITSDDITNHPNYKKYYEEALGGRTGPDAERMAKRSARMKVERDLIKQSAAGVSPTTGAKETTAARVTPAPVATANAVYGASAENAESAVVSGAGTTNNVVAPTTVNNTTNQMGGYKPDVRNQDSSFKRMLDARYVPV